MNHDTLRNDPRTIEEIRGTVDLSRMPTPEEAQSDRITELEERVLTLEQALIRLIDTIQAAKPARMAIPSKHAKFKTRRSQ